MSRMVVLRFASTSRRQPHIRCRRLNNNELKALPEGVFDKLDANNLLYYVYDLRLPLSLASPPPTIKHHTT